LEAFTYRDGVRFAKLREILLQRLRCGQRAEVLSLGGGKANHSLRNKRRRIAGSSSGDPSYLPARTHKSLPRCYPAGLVEQTKLLLSLL